MLNQTLAQYTARMLNRDLKLMLAIQVDRGARCFVSNKTAASIPTTGVPSYDGVYEYGQEGISEGLKYDAGVIQIIDFQPIVINFGTIMDRLSYSHDPVSLYNDKIKRSYSLTMENKDLYWTKLLDRERILNRFAALYATYFGLPDRNQNALIKMKVVSITLTYNDCKFEMEER